MTSTYAWVAAGALPVALWVDHAFGEPPTRLHPVVWMGQALNRAAPWVLPVATADQQPPDFKSFSRGALVHIACAAIIFASAWGLQALLLQLPAVLATLLLGAVLKPMLAWRMLHREVLAVEAALGESLDAGRQRLSWLVSRDTANLSADEVRESAIESLAENLNDSVVAPIFWFVLFGLPGAAVYRFANTADAMWGYRGVRHGQTWEWAGKWAARADDVLSWVPARLTAGLIVAITQGVTFKALRAEARRTPSPNSGWPMAAMAIALGIRLGKPGVYTLNAAGRVPEAADTFKTIKKASNVLVALVFVACCALLLIAFCGAGR